MSLLPTRGLVYFPLSVGRGLGRGSTLQCSRMFEGKGALVTGGASGIGRGVAERLIAEQASVAIADVARAEEVAREIGAFGVSADVSDEEQVARLVEGVVDRFGRLDFLSTAPERLPLCRWPSFPCMTGSRPLTPISRAHSCAAGRPSITFSL